MHKLQSDGFYKYYPKGYNKYTPHEGKKEKERRVKQALDRAKNHYNSCTCNDCVVYKAYWSRELERNSL